MNQPIQEGELTGPYLAAALLCEKVLVEQDGVKTVIRIVDRIIHGIADENPPEVMQPFNYELTLFIVLKNGRAKGSHPLRIVIERPDGDMKTLFQETVFFEGDMDRGCDLICRMMMGFSIEGIYWIKVLFNEKSLTRIPLRIIYQRKFIPPPQHHV